MSDYGWVGPLIGGVAKAANSYGTGAKANEEMQRAYAEMLANLQQRFGDYDALGKAGYQDITAQQVGPSALESIPEDLAARQAQQEALAKLSELAANGGLSLADMQALNEVQANLNRNDSARRQGLANEFAARGQLGSGAQLAMSLDNQQNAAMNANKAGESAAAQAQARALQAILQKGQMAGSMADADYRRKAEAARAHDLIEARNAAARTDAAKSNNAIRGQEFEDELSKARGKTALTNSTNEAVFGRGSQSARTTAAMGSTTNNLIDNGVSAFSKFGSGNSGTEGNTKTAAPSGLSDDDIDYDPDYGGD